MLDGATILFGNCIDLVIGSLTREPAALQEEERWLAVDRAQIGQISLYQSNKQMGVYYGRYEVPSRLLENAHSQIKESYGERNADALLLPFKGEPVERVQDAWLSADILGYFFGTIRNNNIAVIDPGFYHTPEFINSLLSHDRRRLFDKFYHARLIYWPICLGRQGEGHWYLMVIERFEDKAFTINVLDSFNNKHHHREIAIKGTLLLKKLHGDHIRVINENQPSCLVPVQDNPIDCGTAIAYFAYKKAQGESLSQYGEFENRVCSYLHFRMHMALEIARAAQEEVVTHARTSVVISQFRHSRSSGTPAQAHETEGVEKRRKQAIRVF